MKYFTRNIKGQDGVDYVSIYARVRHYSEDKKIAIGFKILPSEWESYCSGKYNPTDWLPTLNISFSHFQFILDQIKTFLENSFDPQAVASDIKKIREQNVFVPAENKVIKCKDKYFSVLLEQYVSDAKDGKILKQGKSAPLTKGYIKDIIHFYNKFTQYEK